MYIGNNCKTKIMKTEKNEIEKENIYLAGCNRSHRALKQSHRGCIYTHTHNRKQIPDWIYNIYILVYTMRMAGY